MKILLFRGWLLFLLGCGTNIKKEGLEQVPIFEPRQTYFSILKNLDPEFPGRGIDVYNNVSEDRPMAYGLILSAEANRFKFEGDSSALRMVRKCGKWLVNNSDRNKNGIIGYGLADAWDAFGDSTLNPIHQEYTITTAVVVKALLDWWECDKKSPHAKEALSIALKCMAPYLNNTYDSPLGIPAYSLSTYDRKYDVFNPATYLAGQMCRIARITVNDSLSNLLNKKSQKIISVMRNNQMQDKQNNLYWNYGLTQKRPNDLIHMAYIVEGLRDFKDNGGDLGISWEGIINHVWLFRSGNKWYERIGKNHHNHEENVRLWALGLLMYTFSREGLFKTIDSTLLPQLALYKKADNSLKFKENDERTMIRQDAHVLLGLSYFLFREKSLPAKK